mgnify:CR=1 FL=1
MPYIADQWFDTDRITVFGFDNLPKYAADGSEFVYTVDDPELHVGFVKTVDNSQYIIHQRYTTFLVRIYHKDQTTNEDLKIMEEQYVAYGDTITLYSENFTDKMLISEPTVVLNNVMAPADVTF